MLATHLLRILTTTKLPAHLVTYLTAKKTAHAAQVEMNEDTLFAANLTKIVEDVEVTWILSSLLTIQNFPTSSIATSSVPEELKGKVIALRYAVELRQT